jgi:C-terminal processing protease CtpA/Prc
VQRFVPKLILPFSLICCAANPGSIGAVLAQSHSDGRITVREAPRGHPAAQVGIGPGDEILLIEGRDVRSMSPETVHSVLVGEVGTKVHLTVLRRGLIERIAVTRAPFAPSPPR